MRRLVLALVAVVVVGAACSSPSHRADPPTTGAPVTTVPAGPNPDIVPTVITPAYVDAVFAVLDHIRGDATRQLYAARAVTAQAVGDLRAIYADPLYAKEVQLATDSLNGDLSNVISPPGDVRTTVKKLVYASPSCVFVETATDYSKVLVKPDAPPASVYWDLRPKRGADDPHGLNPTPWQIGFNAVFKTTTSIPDQCTGS